MSSIISKKGFTLVELLIVIAILAMLAAAVVLVLNPAEMLAQARDAQRLRDLDTLRSALTMYITQVSPLPANALGACPAGGRATVQPGVGLGPFAADVAAGNVSVVNTVGGAGWIDVNFTTTPGGSPIPFLPVDPTGNAQYFYAYACRNAPDFVFELNARLESIRHRARMTADGGNRNTCTTFVEATCFYEVGTDPGLDM